MRPGAGSNLETSVSFEGVSPQPQQVPQSQQPRIPQEYNPPPIMTGRGLPVVVPQHHPLGMSAVRMDPLVQMLVLPSRGFWYPAGMCPGGKIYFAPMRGAQDEVLAGVRHDTASLLNALREITKQCSDLQGLPFEELLLNDWMALLINLLMYSTVTDDAPLKNTCPACKKEAILTLSEIPYVGVRIVETPEHADTPALISDDEARFLAELDGAHTDNLDASDLCLTAAEANEPFQTPKLPGGDVISWKLHRIRDLLNAEDFSKKFATRDVSPKSKLHTFLLASHITHINGEKAMTLRSMEWARQSLSSTLTKFRQEIHKKNFGYSMAPKIRCKTPKCGNSFNVRLPIDGGMFRDLGR